MSAGTAIVVGAGVVGLTSGLRLLEDGWRVAIHARELTPQTTSDVAAAFWFPFRVAPADRVRKWARRTRAQYETMANEQIPGVWLAPLQVLQRTATPPLRLDDWIEGAQPLGAGERPAGFLQAIRVIVPLIDTRVYMPWLQAEFLRRGGRVELGEVASLGNLAAPLVVNCSGVGAHDLVPDARVFPIRGEVLQVARAAIATETILLHEEDDLMTYIVPRGQDCVLGGTAEDGNWDRRPNPENGRRILERCTQLRAELADASGVTHRVGLRPGRDEVRLELEELPDRTAIIHNYGHGGAGFTLAWGCADEVADLARSVRERPPASDGRLQAN